MPDIATDNTSKGVLLLVAGPSGAGKDTLIDAAKEHFKADAHVHFPRRIITREDTTGEDHIPVTASDFDKMLTSGQLFLNWEAHSLKYGVSSEVLSRLEQGAVVILNISRKLIVDARGKWPNTRIVQISVKDDVLLERLTVRGRETVEEVKARFARRGETLDQQPDHIIDNSGEPGLAIQSFIKTVADYLI